MKKLLIMLSFILILTGCVVSEGEYLEYMSDAFNASIKGIINEFEFSAEVKVGKPRAEETGSNETQPRDIEMLFKSPETLKGIKIVRIDGKVTVFSGNMSIESKGASGWLHAAELLTPDGIISNIEISNDNNTRLTVVEITLNNGTPCTLFIDCDTGFPVRVKNGETEIHIAAFW